MVQTLIPIKYSIHRDMICKGDRIVIPVQVAVLDELHHTHVDMIKMKPLAQMYCTWDGKIPIKTWRSSKIV